MRLEIKKFYMNRLTSKRVVWLALIFARIAFLCSPASLSLISLLLRRSTSLAFWTARKTVLEVKNHFEVSFRQCRSSLIDIPYLNRFGHHSEERRRAEPERSRLLSRCRNFLFWSPGMRQKLGEKVHTTRAAFKSRRRGERGQTFLCPSIWSSYYALSILRWYQSVDKNSSTIWFVLSIFLILDIVVHYQISACFSSILEGSSYLFISSSHALWLSKVRGEGRQRQNEVKIQNFFRLKNDDGKSALFSFHPITQQVENFEKQQESSSRCWQQRHQK